MCKIRRRRQAKMLRDGLTARKQDRPANAGASELHWKRAIISMPLAFEKRKTSKEKSRLPSAFRRRVLFHGRGASKRQDSRQQLWLRSSARRYKREEFSAFRCVYIREEYRRLERGER